MKIKAKQNIYITNFEAVDPSNFHNADFGISHGDWMDDTWLRVVTGLEFEFEVDRDDVIAKATEVIDNEIIEMKGKIQHLEDKKAELLALPSPDYGKEPF